MEFKVYGHAGLPFIVFPCQDGKFFDFESRGMIETVKDYIEAGLPVALASDYNPGSSPSGNMRFVMALGCIKMRLTPEQSLNACTINSAYAMGVSDILGSITVGKKANLIITKPVPSLAFIPYSHQTPVIEKVIIN